MARGRPKLDLPADQIMKLARLGCSNVEIADFFGCSEKTIRTKFAAGIAKGRAMRKAGLRELQWEAAKKGNAAILIWLGKNELGQLDQPRSETGQVSYPPPVKVVTFDSAVHRTPGHIGAG